MNKQHKWHKEIKAWADGAEIEHRVGGERWILCNKPAWGEQTDYRIKPQPKEPQYLYVYADKDGVNLSQHKSVFKNGVPLIGKIKLEVDDE